LRHVSHDGSQGSEFRCPHQGTSGPIGRAPRGSARTIRGVRERPTRRFPKRRPRGEDCEQALAGRGGGPRLRARDFGRGEGM